MILGPISKTANISWNILGSTYWTQSIRKNDTRDFCLFGYFQSYNDKSNFPFLQAGQSKEQYVLLANERFLRKMLVS